MIVRVLDTKGKVTIVANKDRVPVNTKPWECHSQALGKLGIIVSWKSIPGSIRRVVVEASWTVKVNGNRSLELTAEVLLRLELRLCL